MIANSGRRIEIRGVVQGVGFRPWVYRLAQEAGIAGSVRNDGAGVLIEAFGPEASLDRLIARLPTEAPAAARIRELAIASLPPVEISGFSIIDSAAGTERRVSIPPDLATCGDCLTELFDPSDRRFWYPFINCTQCGPRYSIAVEIPYDRAATTMAAFRMCPACQREYDDPASRRFHAQPNACPVCGPTLQFTTADGTEVAGHDPLHRAAQALGEGAIVAIKGLGGFHLACDATSELAVAELRRRKRRQQKPFAVMARDPSEAAQLAEICPEERRLLLAAERPIVLLRRRPEAALAAAVAPRSPWLGVFLPYSPLHHLLLDLAACPLVLTSGNVADEPIATGNGEAIERLGGIADFFLSHDRKIENRCDDSVARVIAGQPVVLRRGRGHVPRPIALRHRLEQPILACGGHLKNSFCIAFGDSAFFGPHTGDLETVAACDAFVESVERLERFVGVRPAVIAHDLHPGYWTTSYALQRSAPTKIAVQHHHAHVVSAIAEHGIDGPVLGFAFDGTGYGPDGSAWGSELLLADAASYRRLASFRPIRLAGGDTAIREVWRLALALLIDAFEGAPPIDRLPLFRDLALGGGGASANRHREALNKNRIEVVWRMLAADLHTAHGHGVGRYFDAIGALVLARPQAAYEGQIALEWNGVADALEPRGYPFRLEPASDGRIEVDLRPMVRELVGELLGGTSSATLSGKFHNTLAAVVAGLAETVAERHGELPVVLTGGCFQNDLLTAKCRARLSPRFRVWLHHEVPPGDGGLALGQALAADALLQYRGGAACA